MSMRKRKKVQILSREELRLRRWDFILVPSERGLEAVSKTVCLHIIGILEGMNKYQIESLDAWVWRIAHNRYARFIDNRNKNQIV